MSGERRIYDVSEFAVESAEKATKTVFYTTDATSGSVWVIKPGQTLQRHTHNNSDDIWVCLQGEGVFYPQPDEETPFREGQVLVHRKGDCHGAKNTGSKDIIFVSIVAPVPADYNPLD